MSKEVNYKYQESYIPRHHHSHHGGGGMGYYPRRPMFSQPLFLEQPIYYDPVPRPQQEIIIVPQEMKMTTEEQSTSDSGITQQQNKMTFTNIALHVGVAILILAGLWYIFSGKKKKGVSPQ
jgi:hypothetical protein